MIVGNPVLFAIESDVTQAYEKLSLRALGFFVIHVLGRRFGVKSPDATMLANSFDEVGKRIAERGRHNAPFAVADAGELANAVRRALYAESEGDRASRATYVRIAARSKAPSSFSLSSTGSKCSVQQFLPEV